MELTGVMGGMNGTLGSDWMEDEEKGGLVWDS